MDIQSEIIKKWDRVSQLLDNDPMSPIRYAMGIRYIKDEKKDLKILEIGCGNGKGLALLHSMGFAELSGVEVSPDRIRRASKLLPSSVKLSLIDPDSNLPFADNSFDIILLIAVIEHTLYPMKFMQEVSRILNNNGRCIVSSDCYSWRLLEKLHLHNSFQPIDKTFSYWRFNKFFTISNFKIVHFDTFNLPQRGNIYLDRLYNLFPRYFKKWKKQWKEKYLDIERDNYRYFFSLIDVPWNMTYIYRLINIVMNYLNDENVFFLVKKDVELKKIK